MPNMSSFIPRILSDQMHKSYSTLAEDEHCSDSPAFSDDEKAQVPQTHQISAAEQARFLKQCFTWIAVSTVFIFLATTIIVLSGTASCRASSGIASNTIPKVTPLDLQKEREKALAMLPSPKNPPKHAKSCGPDAATAIAKGCHLDMISFTWLPHECYDAELTEEFLAIKDWKWSLDGNGTELVPRSKVEGGGVDNGYVTWEYHITHCLYTWKKLVRHLERGGAMDWYVMEYSHARHCGKLLLTEGADWSEYNSEFFVQYPLCGYA